MFVLSNVNRGGRALVLTKPHSQVRLLPSRITVAMSALAVAASRVAPAPKAPASGPKSRSSALQKISKTAARGQSIRAKALSVDPESEGVSRRDALIGLIGAVATPVFLYGATDEERESAREAGVPAEPVALAAA